MLGPYSKELMIGLAVGAIVLPTIFFGLRLWARRLRRTRLSTDDWLCFAGLLVGYTCCALQLYAAIDGQLGQHQILGPDGMPILDDPRFLVYERTKLAVNVLSPIGFGLVKASIVVLYEGIFHNIRPFRYCAYVMLGLLFAWSISFFFANLFICYPVTALIEPFYGKKCVDRAGVFLSTLVTDLIFDILILLMPIPVVLRLHLPRKDRLGVLGMFLLGATVVAVSIARLVQLLEVNSQYLLYAYDQTYYTSPAFFWANIELAIAVLSACLPTLKPILNFFFPAPPKPQSKQTDYIKITERQTSRSHGSRVSRLSDNYSTEPIKNSIPLDSYDPEPLYESARVGLFNSLAQRFQSELSPQLSKSNLISTAAPARWSDFDAPDPGVVVNVRTESDVIATVKFCTKRNIPFLAQNGGNGWATTFHLGKKGVLINLAALNQVTFNADKTQATIGGGSTVSNTINKAYAAGALVLTGNCNCVGALGAALGGGYGNLMGMYGFAVDNIISLRVVTADGNLRTVTAKSDPDLFWALRGAGPNLGIVTSATLKSSAASAEDFQAWRGDLVFTEDKLEDVVQAIQDLVLTPDMVIFLYLLADATGAPGVVASPFLYKGNAATGKAAFASLYALGPVADTTAVVPYNQWNTGSDALCARGDFKPGFAAGFQNMIPSTWRQIWDAYVAFQKLPGATSSGVLLEAYDLTKARSVPSSSSAFPNRNVRFNAFAIPWYDSSSLDAQAAQFGNTVRDLLRVTSGLPRNQTYVNFGYGDEALEVVYGDNVPKLRSIKKRYDPKNAFDQWFNIH
ncbi:hypothetical protein F5B21DRAFT_514904 [Xylaria acuta]|nr:hypothetical protein F5B21DRAFT_514904 [Xylaria acuta]